MLGQASKSAEAKLAESCYVSQLPCLKLKKAARLAYVALGSRRSSPERWRGIRDAEGAESAPVAMHRGLGRQLLERGDDDDKMEDEDED